MVPFEAFFALNPNIVEELHFATNLKAPEEVGTTDHRQPLPIIIVVGGGDNVFVL